MAKPKKKDYIYALGRRKGASARVRLYKGEGDNLVNGEVIGKCFPGELAKESWQKPFKVTDTLAKYHVSIKVHGGGKKGQLDAVVHGIARALSFTNREKFRAPIKKAGLLTRDARVRQRRMVGTGGKARRKKQSPKR